MPGPSCFRMDSDAPSMSLAPSQPLYHSIERVKLQGASPLMQSAPFVSVAQQELLRESL